MTEDRGRSRWVVYVAAGTNLAIAAVKFMVAAASGSSAVVIALFG